MPKTNVCSEVTIVNIRLAVRQVVADFCASPERTIESIVNAQFDNFVEPIQRLVATHLECIYEQLQCSIFSPSNEPPLFESVLRFLSEHNDESERDIIQRFEKDIVSLRGQKRDEWQKFGYPSLMSVNPASATVNVPRLENLTNGHSSRDNASDKHRKSAKCVQNSNLFPLSKSTSNTSSTSNDSSLSSSNSPLQLIQASESSRQELVFSERKSSIISSRNTTERSLQHMRSNRNVNMNGEILTEIRNAGDDAPPVVLEEGFIPSVPSIEEAVIHPTLANVKSKVPNSLCSSLRSDDDKVTVRFVPAKIPMIDASVSTDSVFMNNQTVEKIEVGVNTVIEMLSNTADGSSSSNTASDSSAGQLPRRLFHTVLQRPSLRIVSLRPDGSIVPADNSTSRHSPNVREWTPAVSEGNAEKTFLPSGKVCNMASESNLSHSEYNGMGRLGNIVSASASRPDPFEEDLNTLASISPLPHS
uniref:Rho-GAP domain-containing protein n=1 Tax=Elaeophora elaphi TaxID=1147741 RepID=A0A0R3RPF8_9BILA